ncbi:MAG TPA: MFS transporter [Phycisphaerae bacterium]|nr:MFS transporter [Phycisphaerae bacterium]
MFTRRLLVITLIESFATVLVERGVYFFTRDQFRFSEAMNLWLALSFGALYVVGALGSHRVSIRLGEKGLLLATVLAQTVVHAGLTAAATPATVLMGTAALGFLNGLKWPVLESYIGAGHTPASAAKAIGRFNISWAAAVAPSLFVAGPIISVWPRGLFALAAGINLATLLLLRPLSARPRHLPQDHPERPGTGALAHYRSLLASSRWLMLSSYSLLWILAAVMPHVFERSLGIEVTWATACSGVLDVVRLLAFVLLGWYVGWHRKSGPLVAAALALPAGFFLVFFGDSLAVVLLGEVVFGLAAGMVYYSALYYAMVVKNAAVDAGGAHEGLIGAGFAIGPVAGLIATGLTPVLQSRLLGVLVGVGPVILLCSAGALRAMVRGRGSGPRG